jgi:hypothetical protein
MSDPAALIEVDSWPAAFVAVFIILALMVWPGVLAWLNSRKANSNTLELKQKISDNSDTTDIIKKTLTENNGGSHVKDQLDEIMSSVKDLSQWREEHTAWSTDIVKTMATTNDNNSTLLGKVLKQLGQVEDLVTDPNMRRE